MIAAIVLAASQHVAMIVIGRIFQGIAVSPFVSLTPSLHAAAITVSAHLVQLVLCHSVFDSVAQLKLHPMFNLLWLLQISFASVSVPIYNR